MQNNLDQEIVVAWDEIVIALWGYVALVQEWIKKKYPGLQFRECPSFKMDWYVEYKAWEVIGELGTPDEVLLEGKRVLIERGNAAPPRR